MEIYKLQNPFKQIEAASIVKLFPHQMNNDYYTHLKRNLESKIVGKCNNDGIFTEVLRLISFEDNEINSELFTGDAEYRLRFVATICVPIIGTATILRIDKIMSQYEDVIISAENRYLKCGLPLSYNKKILHMDKGQIIVTNKNKPLNKGDYIKVGITNKKVDASDTKIGIFGSIIDVATPEEIQNFFNDKLLDEEVKDEGDNLDAIYNDDDDDTNEI